MELNDGFLSRLGNWAGHEMQMPSAAAGATVHVDKDNVMQAGKVIQDQVDHLMDVYRQNAPSLQVQPPGNDLVSTQMAKAWTWRLSGADDSYATRVQQYIQSLQGLCDKLRDSATQYGYNEDEVTQFFGPKNA